MPKRNQVVIDIETATQKLEDWQIKALTKHCKNDEDRANEIAKAPLYATTGQVICVCLHDLQSGDVITHHSGNLKEREILAKFWEDVSQFRQVITFNGRSFDVPFLLLRSMVHGIVPTANLMGQRFSVFPHCDLADQLSYYGATKKFSLDTYLRMMGIETSKGGGITGETVGDFYSRGRHQEIADYCERDVVATGQLFKRWAGRIDE